MLLTELLQFCNCKVCVCVVRFRCDESPGSSSQASMEEWIQPTVSGTLPTARWYQSAAMTSSDVMWVFGGNDGSLGLNGRYPAALTGPRSCCSQGLFNDLWLIDLKAGTRVAPSVRKRSCASRKLRALVHWKPHRFGRASTWSGLRWVSVAFKTCRSHFL